MLSGRAHAGELRRAGQISGPMADGLVMALVRHEMVVLQPGLEPGFPP